MMQDLKAVRDGAVVELPGVSVCQQLCVTPVYNAIPHALLATSPHPTAVGLLDVPPEVGLNRFTGNTQHVRTGHTTAIRATVEAGPDMRPGSREYPSTNRANESNLVDCATIGVHGEPPFAVPALGCLLHRQGIFLPQLYQEQKECVQC